VSTKLIRGKYLIQDSEHVIENGAVLIKDDEIVDVGDYKNLKENKVDEVLGSDAYLVSPGFVNAHAHGKGLSDFQLGALDDFLEVWRFRLYPDIDDYYDSLWQAIKLLESGVTTTMHNHIFRYPDAYNEEITPIIKAYQSAGIRLAFAPAVTDQNFIVYGNEEQFVNSLPSHLKTFAGTFRQRAAKFTSEKYFKAINELRSDYNNGKIKIMHGPLSPQWCSDDLLKEVKRDADAHSMKIHIHVLQTMLQKMYGLRTYKKSLLEHLSDIGFLDKNVVCGHSVWLTDRDIALMASTGTSVTHHASCNLRVRNGICPVFDLFKRGVKVAIGIDEKGLSDDEDMIEEMRLVSKLHRIPSHRLGSEYITPRDCFKMGTQYGAAVLGFDQEIGSLHKGKKADIVMINLERIAEPYMRPDQNVIDRLIYRGKAADVDTVLVDGEVVIKDHKFTKIDKDEVIRKLRESIPQEDSADVIRMKSLLSELKGEVVKYFNAWHDEMTTNKIDPYYLFNNRL